MSTKVQKRNRSNYTVVISLSMTPGEAVDILVVSASPNDFLPTQRLPHWHPMGEGRLGAANWSRHKEVDLRKTSSCWLSAPLGSKPPGIEFFDRILCFEPPVRGNPPEVVGDIFRSLVPFLGLDAMGTTVAMPLVACGEPGMPVASDVGPPAGSRVQLDVPRLAPEPPEDRGPLGEVCHRG